MLTVHVPAGIRDGQIVRVRGEGEPGEDGTSRGDLHVICRVDMPEWFARHGDDLVCQVPISFTQAALGASVPVPTVDGLEEIDVPAGTQNGDILTLRRRGLPNTRTGRNGDEHVQLIVEIPRKLNETQRELLEQYAQTEDVNVSPRRKSFFEKLKDYFSGKP